MTNDGSLTPSLTWGTRSTAAIADGEAPIFKLVLRVENPLGLGAFGLTVS